MLSHFLCVTNRKFCRKLQPDKKIIFGYFYVIKHLAGNSGRGQTLAKSHVSKFSPAMKPT